MNIKLKTLISIILIFVIFVGVNLFLNQGVYASQVEIKDYTKLNDEEYPGIKDKIAALKKEYPNYNFIIYDTDLEWEDVITMEYQGHYNSPRNLVEPSDNKTGMWICPICTETAYDSGRWRCASIEAIEYMMDPRNSLDINSIFQFEELGGKGSNNYTKENIALAVKGTFLDKQSIIDTIYNSCREVTDPSKKYYSISDYLYDYDIYRALYADLQKAYGNDKAKYKEHWLNCGIKEGRIASSVFDAKYYLEVNEDLKKKLGTDYKKAYEHFINTGIYENRKASRFFDVKYYLDKYDDLYVAFNNNPALALRHFVDNGITEERIASSDFQLPVYKKLEDLKKAYKDDNKKYIIHYLAFGIKEKRVCSSEEYKTVTVNSDRPKINTNSVASDGDMNPLYLVSLIIQEQGKNGSTLSLGQGYNGQYVGYYNLLNIGAYGSGKDKVILNGLKKAQDEGWTSPEEAIRGGITFLKQSYIDRGQNSLYTQKFDIVGEKLSELFQHQYQQNVMAAENEGRKLKTFYQNTDTLESSHTFIIPVYNNMPKTACARPDTGKTNTTHYEDAKVNVNSSLTVRSRRNSGGYTVGSLSNGEAVKIIERAKDKSDDGFFRDVVVNNKGYYGYATREEDGKTYLNVTGSGATTNNTDAPSTPSVSDTPSVGNSSSSEETPKLLNNISKRLDITPYLFDYRVYRDRYADLQKAYGDNEAKYKEHWLGCGIKEGRVASLVFDAKYYVEKYADLKKAYGNNYQKLYEHFIGCGIHEGRIASPVFDAKYYLTKYEDLQKAFGSLSYSYALMHFYYNGCNEFRITTEEFNVVKYKDSNEDLSKAFGNKSKLYYKHYIEFGYKENRVVK